MKTGQCSFICLTIVAMLFGETSAECSLKYCDSCPDGVHCKACTLPYGLRSNAGVYGFNANRTGCEDCFEISEYTCQRCHSITHCNKCSGTGRGYVLDTTTAQCDSCHENCEYMCDVRGAGKCDEGHCSEGFASDADHGCSACADGCWDCKKSGPGKCDT